MLSGYSEPLSWNQLCAGASVAEKTSFLALIDRETENASRERQAHIIAKMNSLCDQGDYRSAVRGIVRRGED